MSLLVKFKKLEMEKALIDNSARNGVRFLIPQLLLQLYFWTKYSVVCVTDILVSSVENGYFVLGQKLNF